MFSSTTTELSDTIPMPKAIPARLKTFRVRPNQDIMKNVPIKQMGMAATTTSVLVTLRRNSSRIPVASSAPK